MKSEYRCLVEAIICCEQKLKEAKALQHDAQERLTQANVFVEYQESSLQESERKLIELESKILAQEPPGLGDEIKEINASLKIICREVMRPEV